MYENLNVCRRVRFTPYAKGMGPTFALTLWDDLPPVGGRFRLRYRLTMCEGKRRTVLFQGDDFSIPGNHCTDSAYAVDTIMAFLTYGPGSAFGEGTEVQRAFWQRHAEILACEVSTRFSEGI